jgi:hypothetical protein
LRRIKEVDSLTKQREDTDRRDWKSKFILEREGEKEFEKGINKDLYYVSLNSKCVKRE